MVGEISHHKKFQILEGPKSTIYGFTQGLHFDDLSKRYPNGGIKKKSALVHRECIG